MTIDNDGDGINDSNWQCLSPNVDNRYKGTIEGSSHTIYNLSMTGNGDDFPSFIGFWCEGAKISNLNFADIHLKGGNKSASIAVLFFDGLIENCHVLSGTIEGKEEVAGVVGQARNSSVVNCSNAATIISESLAGGITIQSFNSNADNPTQIVACRNSGEIKGNYSGGVVTIVDKNSNVAGCYNIGKVTGTEYGGGVLCQAHAGANVFACYNTGSVTADSGKTNGIVDSGRIYGSPSPTFESNYTGGSSPSGGDYGTTVDGTTTTWDMAKTAMNKALTTNSNNWEYVENGGSDTATCPLIIQAKTETESE